MASSFRKSNGNGYMKITELQKAQSLFARVQKLETDISEIERTSALLTDEDFEMNLNLIQSAVEPENTKPSQGHCGWVFQVQMPEDEADDWKKAKDKLKEPVSFRLKVSNRESLFMLESLLKAKQFERLALLKQLAKFGITV
jgi:hypothetical protein